MPTMATGAGFSHRARARTRGTMRGSLAWGLPTRGGRLIFFGAELWRRLCFTTERTAAVSG